MPALKNKKVTIKKEGMPKVNRNINKAYRRNTSKKVTKLYFTNFFLSSCKDTINEPLAVLEKREIKIK
jgi:hypothetical protein